MANNSPPWVCTEFTQSRVILAVYTCAQLRSDLNLNRSDSTLLITAELMEGEQVCPTKGSLNGWQPQFDTHKN